VIVKDMPFIKVLGRMGPKKLYQLVSLCRSEIDVPGYLLQKKK